MSELPHILPEIKEMTRQELELYATYLEIASQALKNELISRRRELKKKEEDSLIDPQTGLYNSRYFTEKLIPEELAPNVIGERRKSKETIIFGFMDVDGAKEVNDLYGHHVGDMVIESVAEVLKDEVRGTDIVGRRYDSGDEFYVLLRLIGGEAKDIEAALDSFKGRVRRQIKLATEGLVDISSGFMEVTTCKSPEEVVREADHRMYQDKEVHRQTDGQATS